MRGAMVGVLFVALAACEDEQVIVAGGGTSAAASAPGPRDGAPEADRSRASPLRDLSDDVFTEADVGNRDPFRSFTDHFRPEAPKEVQRRVIMPEVAVEQMHLVAIVTRLPKPRAMLVDPAGVGHVVKPGDYVGRAEVVQTGGAEGMPVTLNWRVDRIRNNEVVLSREDPTDPDQPPMRRALALRDEADLVGSRTFK